MTNDPEVVAAALALAEEVDNNWDRARPGPAYDRLKCAVETYRAAVTPKRPDLARLLRKLHVETQQCDRPCKPGTCDWHDLQQVVRAFTTLSEDAQKAAYDCREQIAPED